ncbi:hypothetical protein G1K63_00455 [Tenacibaculum finnmarkense]|uniref:hypothetical protein n=1 Tax=Tenacibaculum finnmarkense TaxID=2781243 RepID=UPI001EFBC1B4|nr:hypothetical protein [Tenacibaculum finnmarkense]MCD8412184.1 hypothetical protein [Tenacibaculum finnmarkense genomovar ulcerans]MCG8722001.1 hypothetical protein [Tenacibaculum finnmarkense]
MRIFILLLLISIYQINAQDNFCYKILSQKDSIEINDAAITMQNGKIHFSNDLGVFCVKKKYDSILISHINYKSKYFFINTLNNRNKLYLEEKKGALEEVVIVNKKRKLKRILPKKSFLSHFGFKGHNARFNSISATYLPNTKKHEAIIKNIIIEPSEGYWGDPKKQYMPFRVNLYSLDSLTKLPKTKILPDTILVAKKKGGKKYVIVNIKKYGIEFPPEGIFVSVQTLPEYEYKYRKSISDEAPAFKILNKEKNSKNITYTRKLNNYGEIKKDWIDKTLPGLHFIYNFGIEILK